MGLQRGGYVNMRPFGWVQRHPAWCSDQKRSGHRDLCTQKSPCKATVGRETGLGGKALLTPCPGPPGLPHWEEVHFCPEGAQSVPIWCVLQQPHSAVNRHVTSGHMERCSTSVAIREKQIETAIDFTTCLFQQLEKKE